MKALFFISLVLLIGCNNDQDCAYIDCLTSNLYIEFVDSNTQENLIENGEIDPGNISIYNNDTGISLAFSPNETEHFIALHTDGFASQLYNLTINTEREVVQMNVDLERKKGECCTYSRFTDIDVINAEFVLIDQDFVRILL